MFDEHTTSSLTQEMVMAIDMAKASIALALEDFEIQKLSHSVEKQYRSDERGACDFDV
jgi:hypothetical protein